jgi:integrase
MTTRRTRRSWGKIQRMRSGRYQASYTGPDLACHTGPATYTSRIDAEGWLHNERRLIEHGEWTAPALRAAAKQTRSQSLNSYATTWLENRTLKPRTRQGYQELLDGPLAKLHTVPLTLITGESIRQWHHGLGTATPTKNAHAYSFLHAILATALSDGLITVNPCAIRSAMNVQSKRQSVIRTPDEIAKVALALPDQLKALLLISAWAGLRWGEAVELRRRDFNVACDEIDVTRAFTHRAGQCSIDTPKSGVGRQVILPPHIVQDARDHLALYVAQSPDAQLFPAKTSCHYSDRLFREAFAEALKAVGITKNPRIHDLRHFAGTQSARVGSLIETMDRLGHSTIRASLRYQHVASGRSREVADALSALAQVPTLPT